jgi:hypothetical protein
LENEVKRPYLSMTQLDMLSKCGEQYRRRYVDKEIIPPGVAAVVGKATDRSVNQNLEHKIATKELLPIEAVADTARDGLNQEWQSGVILGDEEVGRGVKAVKGEAVDKAVRLSVLHAKQTAPTLEPTHVQRKWTVEISGYPMDLFGFIDVQEGTNSVRDTKTAGKTPNGNVADQSDQLTGYALAVRVLDGKAPEKVVLDYLIDNKTPVAKSFESTRDGDDFAALLHRVEVAIVALEKGVFIPARQTDWWCSPKWCGFHGSCRYVRQPKQFST